MATRLSKSAVAANTMGRVTSERWLFLTNRSLFHLIDGELSPWACVKRRTLRSGVDK